MVAPMRIASAAEFVASPVGRYCVGEQFVVWARTPTISGTIAWGRISARIASALVAVWKFEARLEAPYAAVIDVAAVDAVESDAFEIVFGYMQAVAPVLATRIVRQALVRPRGMPGALVAGFYPTLSPGFEWRDFAASDEAYRWCFPTVFGSIGELDQLVANARASDGILPRVTAALQKRLQHPPSLEELGEQLGLSPRSLQRAMHSAGTSLRNELTRVRVEVAARRLRESDDKIEAIASAVGFASLSAFAAAFRKRMGATPSAYRQGPR